MILFEYACDNCGDVKNNQTMESFICFCGGTMRSLNTPSGNIFSPYYHPDLKEHICSSKDEKRAYKKHKVIPFGDCHKLREKAKYIRKNREEIIAKRYAKQEGKRYKPGSNVRWSDDKKDFVSPNAC